MIDSTALEKLRELARILRCAPNLLKQYVPGFSPAGDPLKLQRALELVTELLEGEEDDDG